jgi:glycosyltransferase involved in cell wall biosynthesis
MTQSPQPLISIIVAVYNGATTLQRCINSISQQSYANKQLIIIDGGSNDGSVELLKANQQYFDYMLSEPDTGIYSAWNKGLLKVQGEWVCFLGADDYFRDDQVLSTMAQHLVQLPESIRVAYGQIMLVNSAGEELYLSGSPWPMVKERLKQLMSIPHLGTMHRRSLFEQFGPFNESFRIAGDYELLLRELKSADAAFIPNLVTVVMSLGGISSTPANALLQLREVRHAQHLQGLRLGPIWMLAMARVYIRLILWRIVGEKNTRQLLDIGRRMMGLPAFWTRA